MKRWIASLTLIAALVMLYPLTANALPSYPTFPSTLMTLAPSTPTIAPIVYVRNGTELTLQWTFDYSRLGLGRSLLGFHVYRGEVVEANRLTDFPVKEEQDVNGQQVFVFTEFTAPATGVHYTIKAFYSDNTSEVVAQGDYLGDQPVLPPIMVLDPSTPPPLTTLIADINGFSLDAVVTGHRVTLTWRDTLARDEDIGYYVVYRRKIGQSGPEQTLCAYLMGNSYVDIVPTGRYEYMVVRYDDAAASVWKAVDVTATTAERYTTISLPDLEYRSDRMINYNLLDDFKVVYTPDMENSSRCLVELKLSGEVLAGVLNNSRFQNIPLGMASIDVWEVAGSRAYRIKRIQLVDPRVVSETVQYSPENELTFDFILAPTGTRSVFGWRPW